MTDLDAKFQEIRRNVPPDLWPSIETRVPFEYAPTTRRRWPALIVAFLVGIGGLAVAWEAFRDRGAQTPASTVVVTSPAPRECPFGDTGASTASTEQFLQLTNGRGPTWLPSGFGLAQTWTDHADWSDATCREVTMYVSEGTQPPARDNLGSVGDWLVVADASGSCGNAVLGQGRCLEYLAQTPDGLTFRLQTIGVDRPDGDRIALSVSLDSGSSAPTPTPTYLPEDQTWAPATRTEGDRTIMPVTFPDGTTAELTYPDRLALQDLNVYLGTYADGPHGCGSQLDATRSDPHGGWLRGDSPLWEHMRPDGNTVELWNGGGGEILVYRFGAWSVMLHCQPNVTDQALATWADNLDGDQTPDGLLALVGSGPVHVNPWHDQNGPSVRLSDQHVIIDIQPQSDLCAPGGSQDVDTTDGVVQWCPRPEGSVRVYAIADGTSGRDLLQALVDGLEVHAVGQT